MDIQPKVNNAQINKIKAAFLQYFATYLDGCSTRLDFEFGLQLGKERDKLSKDQYKKITDYLRGAQQDIRQQYLQKISVAFDELQQQTLSKTTSQVQWSAAKLLDDEFVKEDYAVSQIIRNCEHIFIEELSLFNQQLASLLGKKVISSAQNPASPENLLRILFEVFKPLKLNTEYRLALYNVFDANVFSQLGFIYRELLKNYSITTKEQVAIFENIRSEISPDTIPGNFKIANDVFEPLRQKLQYWRSAQSPSAFDLLVDTGSPIYEQFELINALQVLSYEGLKHVMQVDASLKHRLLHKLEALNFSGEARQLSQSDQDILDFVALIFAKIGQEETLPSSVKSAIVRLQMPVAGVALLQPDVLVEPQSPIRQLLDKLIATGSLVNEDSSAGQAIIEQIADVADKMTTDSGFDIASWVNVDNNFSTYLNAQQHRAQRYEAHYLELMQQSEMPLKDNAEVAMIIADRLNNKILPAAISDFLRQAWLQVLLAAYQHKQEQPEIWQKYLQTLDDLIFSVSLPNDEPARQRILNLLPGLIKALRHGLKQIAHDKVERGRFFKELAVLHVLVLDKKSTSNEVIGNTPEDSLTKLLVADIEPFMELIKQLPEGSWLVFVTDSCKHWGKLAWKSQDLQRLLFLDKGGEKLLECGMAELAEQLHTAKASLITVNQQPFTERIIANLAP
ncbi:MAG: DUF1631 family protein [Methylococcaceae bacterium]|nr:DUF1631 family protein [Methylococcaceae bacterium]MDZ4157577.1 DUF1631 family protein [Methylococcales bacterium]MDP2395064.1 DUF1631 family protein [Methylococcaceae bacterium]MDP3019315.1 DUF1631 family protein [Methylococcaceae bacterium]MDP3389105.1 DUF1631 family protein [Methylococcaceae bacterium]